MIFNRRPHRAVTFLFAFFSFIATGTAALAEETGRLSVTVRNLNNREPVGAAHVTLHDLMGVHPDVVFETSDAGAATGPALEAGQWMLVVEAPAFIPVHREVSVHGGSVSSVEVALEPRETTIHIIGSGTLLRSRGTSGSAERDHNFLKRFPVAAQSSQQLTGLLTSNPGFVENSTNQVHPRGEHSATSIYLHGYQLGGASQGRFGPTLNPETFEHVDILTGGFAPEFAGSAAVLDGSIRSGSARPFSSLELGGGSYESANTSFSMGGQAGRPIGAPDAEGYQSKIFSYFISGSTRNTHNALEAPQPDVQSAHNRGSAQTLLGHFDLTPSLDDQFSLIVNAAPAQTQIANRTGLSDKYRDIGQGYGFGGALSAEDAAAAGILNQDQLGQDIYQRDLNSFGTGQWRHRFSDTLNSELTLGIDQSKLATLNNNPIVDLGALPEDSSIEYNPEVRRDTVQKQVAASLTKDLSSHSIKVGGQYKRGTSDDSYQLTPASQLALNALYAADPRLVPAGTPLVDGNGEPVLDSQGNQVYQAAPGARSLPLSVDSDTHYTAAYLQDTWDLTSDFTANYGVRFDSFRQTQQQLEGRSVDSHQFSPRANLSWSFLPGWIARTSYNRLFVEPPLSQGSLIGESIKPSRVHQYEGSIEHEFTPRQKAKISYYVKDIKDQIDTGLLIPSTQMGVFTSVNLDRARVRGFEFSYDLLPDHGFGLGSYVAYAYSVAKPSGFDNTGEPVEKYNDHDQRHTVSSGVSYTFVNSASISGNLYYGSGVASSVLTEDGGRDARSRVNLVISSPPKFLFNRGALRLTVTNLFDDRSVISFNSAFSGTRFQQAQSFMLSAVFEF